MRLRVEAREAVVRAEPEVALAVRQHAVDDVVREAVPLAVVPEAARRRRCATRAARGPRRGCRSRAGWSRRGTACRCVLAPRLAGSAGSWRKRRALPVRRSSSARPPPSVPSQMAPEASCDHRGHDVGPDRLGVRGVVAVVREGAGARRRSRSSPPPYVPTQRSPTPSTISAMTASAAQALRVVGGRGGRCAARPSPDPGGERPAPMVPIHSMPSGSVASAITRSPRRARTARRVAARRRPSAGPSCGGPPKVPIQMRPTRSSAKDVTVLSVRPEAPEAEPRVVAERPGRGVPPVRRRRCGCPPRARRPGPGRATSRCRRRGSTGRSGRGGSARTSPAGGPAGRARRPCRSRGARRRPPGSRARGRG